MKKSIRLLISGAVQGVFFRGYIEQHALKNNVRGFVRNLEDGRVEVFLEGDSKDVDKMIPLCKRGPQHSQVRSVEEKEEAFQDFKEFKVLHF